MITVEDLEISIQSRGEETLLRLLVKPGASREAVLDVFEDRLRVSLKERALEGRANQALVSFLAKLLKLSKSSVTLLKGERSRQKLVKVPLAKSEVVRLIIDSTREKPKG